MMRSIRLNGRKPYATSLSRLRHDDTRNPTSGTAIASYERGLRRVLGTLCRGK